MAACGDDQLRPAEPPPGGPGGWKTGGGSDEGARAQPDEVFLDLPADSAYASIARTATMELGLRAGFDWPTLTSLALAIDETLVMLLGPSGPAPHPDDVLRLRFTVHHQALELRVTAHGRGPAIDPDGEAAARFIEFVGDLVDSWSLDADQHAVTLKVGDNNRRDGVA